MIYTEYLGISDCIIHVVGNKAADGGLFLSHESIILDEETETILKKYLFAPITNDGYYGFWHETDLGLNEVYSYIRRIFSDSSTFVDMSRNIAKHLYACSTHPKIKSGELCVVYLKNIIIDTVTCNAIGIFKSENKDTFLKVITEEGRTTIKGDSGININKLDKGAIVFNTDADTGYKISVVDKTNKATEAKYWTDEFLKAKPRKNSYNQTENLIAMTREFVSKMVPSDFKSDKAVVISRSNDVISDGRVNLVDYSQKVFQREDLAMGFKDFAQKKAIDSGFVIDDEFAISKQAVKKKKTTTLTTLKLDQNFDIHIRGGENLLEKGYDEEKGMKYYKLYFKEEK